MVVGEGENGGWRGRKGGGRPGDVSSSQNLDDTQGNSSQHTVFEKKLKLEYIYKKVTMQFDVFIF